MREATWAASLARRLALGRIAYLSPDLYDEVVRQAEEMYRDQIGEEHPFQWKREVVEQVIELVAAERGNEEA